MAEFGWSTLEVMQEHLQHLVSQEYMTMAELATCRVPEDPASPIQAGGGGDTSWHVRHSLSEGSVFYHTDFSALYCSSMAWNYIT
jgi:hypothetical protein